MVDIKRVVLFGHKPESIGGFLGFSARPHTHSYIHSGYLRAFRHLGYETFWLDDRSQDLGSFPTEGTLFFTEDQVDQNIPLSSKASYITHSSSKSKYEDVGAKRLNLCNYVDDLNHGVSYNYPENQVEKINEVTFFDLQAKALYQPWATDLLPDEIQPDQVVAFDPARTTINYVGTIKHDNIAPRFKDFSRAARAQNVLVKHHQGVSDSKARQLVRESFFSLDIRGDWHLERGYIPCRLWKNLSYGMPVVSNSLKLEGIFGDRIGFNAESEALFQEGLAYASQQSNEQRWQNMLWIRENHTFVNRAQMCLEILRTLD